MKKIGILCAGDSELEPFLSHIHSCTVVEKAMLKVHEGELEGIPVAAVYSGVCKVNAAIAAQVLIDCFQVEAVINAGTAGGMEESLQIFDTVVSTQALYHDVEEHILTEFHPWMQTAWFPADQELLEAAKRAALQERNVFFGRMATGEQFITEEHRLEINRKYAPLSVDMETRSIAHVCYVNRIPFLSVRTLTDTAVHSGTENFERNCSQASAISKDFVLSLLRELYKQPKPV